MRIIAENHSTNKTWKDLAPRLHLKLALLVAILIGAVASARAQNAGAPAQSRPATSLAESLKRADKTQLHIFYVHGMAADGPNHSDSASFRKSVCARLKKCKIPEGGVYDGRDYADKHSFVLDGPTPNVSYLGEQIWKSREGGSPSEGWNAAAPFVDHWILELTDGSKIYVDEINWWPLVFSAKCRQIVAKDAALAGPSKIYLDTCSSLQEDPKTPKRFLSYSWIEPSEAKRLEAIPAHGARLNRSLKSYVLDWGFSDAVLAVGPLQNYLKEGIRQLIRKSVHLDADGLRGDNVEPAPNQEFVIVSHSLGSYLIFAALDFTDCCASPMQPWQQEFEKVLGHTSAAYFFANQLRLLELANLDVKSGANMVEHLETWGCLRLKALGSACDATRNVAFLPKVVAWSDPSDLLSWNVPDLTSVNVENRPVQNAIHWFWLIENPTAAHGNYVTNRKVIGALFEPEKHVQSK